MTNSPSIALPSASVCSTSRGKPSARPSATPAGEDDAGVGPAAVEERALHVRLDEADLAAERTRRDAAVRAQEPPAARIHHIVARVA